MRAPGSYEPPGALPFSGGGGFGWPAADLRPFDHLAAWGVGATGYPLRMARNVEIKASVSDPAALRERARAMASAPPVEIEQVDTFFPCERGRLKLRRFADGTGELIHYDRPDEPGPSPSEYERVEVGDAAALGRALGEALGVRGVVRKRRTLLLVGRTRVHLDAVEGLGAFLELEVVLREGEAPGSGALEARGLMVELGVRERDLVDEAYIDLLERAGLEGRA